MKKSLCFLLTVLCLCLTAGAFAEAEQPPLKIILSSDMDYMGDDTLALSMLVNLERQNAVEISGIIVTGGNNFIEAQYESAYGLKDGSYTYLTEYLHQIGREDIPVFRGTDYPLGFSAENIGELKDIHRTFLSEDGTVANRVIVKDTFGAVWHFHDFDGALADDTAAEDYLIDEINAHPNEIVIVSVGPLTSVARAVRKDPSIAAKTKALYLMGGAFGALQPTTNVYERDILAVPGANTTNYAEYNVFYDPAAFAEVLQAGFENIVITSAVCNAPVPQNLAEMLTEAADGHADAIMQSWIDYHTSVVQDYPYWDPMTVYALMRPDRIAEQKIGYIMENTDVLSEQYGESIFFDEDEYRALPQEEQALCGKATVISSMNGFWDYVLPLLAE